MKGVRVWFKKEGIAKYISHLDLSRCMSRAIHGSKLPIWYTQGFNPHPFMTFALPLSLGITGVREAMDIRITEEISYEDIANKLNKRLPKGVQIMSISEPIMDASDISHALFSLSLFNDKVPLDHIESCILKLINLPEINVSKKTKSGEKVINLKEYISGFKYTLENNRILCKTILPAGNSLNINPVLILDALKKYCDIHPYYEITREEIYSKDKKLFE